MPREPGKARPRAQEERSHSPLVGLKGGLATQIDNYRELINTVPAVFWRANAQTFQFTYVSQYSETLLGCPPQAWIEQPSFWEKHLYQEDRDWAVARRAETVKKGGNYDIEYRLINAEGLALWVRELGHVGANGGELTGIIIDLSEKRSEQETLGEGKRWLREVVDSIPQQIWSGPSDGSLDFCNARWRNELGFKLEEIQGDQWQRMLHPDDRDRVLKAWHESVTNGTPYEQQERHRMANGEYRWFLCRGVPMRDDHGNIVRWFGTNTDIDEQKRAEGALRKSEQRWRAVFDNSSVGITLLDQTGRFLASNAAFEKMLGYSGDELSKLRYQDVTYSEDLAPTEASYLELWEGKRQRLCLEKRCYGKNGQLLWTRNNGSLVSAGDARFATFIVEDITELKRLEAQLRRERDRLRLLLDLSNIFVSKLGLKDFFDALAGSLREVEGWEYSIVALPESPDRLRIQLVGGNKSALTIGSGVPIEGTFAGEVYRSGQLQLFSTADLHAVPNYPELTSWHEFARTAGLQIGCDLPLLYDGKVLGVLGLHSRKDMESARHDLGFLQELAKLVALALHNALRYGELSESHEKLVYQKNYIEDQIRSEFGFESIIGQSDGLRDVLKQVNAVAPTDTTVLITGETGTGKELIARAIHDHSPRHDHSFIKVDCTAIPATLMESELFGHEKGAFTGATALKIGRFEAADQGTLFLDEVGDIPLELQTKLLRVLQDHAFERLGSNRTRHVDVRIVAATNRSLEEMVESGKFREDVYYRLKVFPIDIPPLRERVGDIPLLVQHYVAKYARRMKKDVSIVPATTMEVFKRYPWPGNVRELQHFIERSVVISRGKVLQAPVSELERLIEKRQHASRRPVNPRTLKDVERESILQVLKESNWVVGGPNGAAAKLGIKRTTLASRMERLGIWRRQHTLTES